MADRTVAVRLLAKVDQYKAGLKSAAAETDAFSKKAKTGFKSVGTAAATLGTGSKVALVGASAAMTAFAVSSIKAASDLNETASKVQVLFGSSSQAINDWASTAAQSMGQSKKEALDAAADFGVFGKAAGLTGDSLVKFSEQNTQLAGDLASFYNTSPADAITAIGAAMRGEQEPIRAYGVLIDDASTRQQAFAMGLISTTKHALTPQQRVLAVQALIMKQTGAAQGDFARTSNGLANQQRILTAEFTNMQAELGTALLPAAITVTGALTSMIGVVNKLPEPIKLVALGIGIIGAAALLAAPRIMATVEAIKALGLASPGAVAGLKSLAAAAVGIGIVTAATEAMSTAAADLKTRMGVGAVQADEWTKRLSGPGAGQALQSLSHDLAVAGSSAAQFGMYLTNGVGAKSDIDNAKTNVANLDAALAAMVGSGNSAQAASIVKALGDNVGDASATLPGYTAALGALPPPIKNVATTTTAAAAAVRTFGQAFAAAMGTLSQAAALVSVNQATTAWTDSLKKNKTSLDAGTKAGQANITQLDQSIGAIGQARDANIKAASSHMSLKRATEQADSAAQSQVATLRKAFIAAGGTAAQFDALTGAIGRVPSHKSVTVTTNAARVAAAVSAVRSQLDTLHDKTVVVHVVNRLTSGGGTAKADGGLLSGPGTGTSDSIPLMASNGEFIVNAASTARNLDLLHAINAGDGYAKGGKVQPTKKPAGPPPLSTRGQARLDLLNQLRQARQSSIDSVSSSMASSAGLLGAFDFTAQARSIDALAQAQQRLADASKAVATADDGVFAARQAINAAGTPQERAAAEEQLTKALEAQAAAKKTVGVEEKGVAAAKAEVKATAANPGNILAAWRSKIDNLVRFEKNIKKLRALGFGPALIAQIASDPNAAELAAALVSSSPKQIASFNHLENELTAVSGVIGSIAGNSEFNGQINSARKDAMAAGVPSKLVGAAMPIFHASITPQKVTVQIGAREIVQALADYGVRVGS